MHAERSAPLSNDELVRRINIDAVDFGVDRQGTGAIHDDKVTITLVFKDGSWGTIHYLANGHSSFPKERVEVFCKGLWNSWGQQEDRWGQMFLTDGAGSTGVSWAFPGAVWNPSEGSRKQIAAFFPMRLSASPNPTVVVVFPSPAGVGLIAETRMSFPFGRLACCASHSSDTLAFVRP